MFVFFKKKALKKILNFFLKFLKLGFGAGWFLDKVIVTNGNTNKKNYFLFGRWLADDEGDKKLEAEVRLKSE